MTKSELHQKFTREIGEFTSDISARFLNLSDELKLLKASPEQTKAFEKAFKKILSFTQSVSSKINRLIEEGESSERDLEFLNEEIRKLKLLYITGIKFLSETEMEKLMESALDVVSQELKADSGFIVFLNEEGGFEKVVSRNVDPETDTEARELSTSVIDSTVKSLQPGVYNNLEEEAEFARRTSVVNLGLKAALAVPLISGEKVIGAVYLDRRGTKEPFSDADLVFLISFSKQIVKGMEISIEIATLEDKLAVENCQRMNELRKEFNCEEIVGCSRKLFSVMKLASKVAKTDVNLVLLGENGTGKDLIARAVHDNSSRADNPFVAINCGAIPADLLESELFGYDSGAFTGATKSKPGKLEMAEGGTIFLDEISEMSANLQVKLLRVIQTRELERLGSVTPKKIDVRFIAATNRNIKQLIEEKQFREDLYYRLKVIEIHLPALRERREDIEVLTDYFLEKYADGKVFTISSAALETLMRYEWPGNVRELENVIQRCIVLAKSNLIEVDDLPAEITEEDDFLDLESVEDKSLAGAEKEFRKFYIMKALRNTNSKAEAAKQLGVNRTHFYKLLSQLGIEE